MRSLPFIATLITLTACPGPVAPSPDAGADEPDAGPADAGLDCGSSGVQPEAPCGTLAWSESVEATRPRNHHSSAIATVEGGTFLYVMGGVNGSALIDKVDRARVNADGSLGKFEELPQHLLFAEGGGTAQILHGVLLVAGGNAGGITAFTEFAQIAADGSLSEFRSAGDMNVPRMHLASFVRGDYVYLMGGFRHPDVWDDAIKARWYPNDTLAAWEPAGKLPGKRTHMAVTRVGDFAYLTGGLEESPYTSPPWLKSTFRGQLDADGNLGGWVPQTDLPVGLCTHASAYWGGYLYVMGGINETPDQEKRVWRAPIGADHSLGAWAEVAALPVGRGHVHDLPMFGNHIYSIGGALDFSLNATGAIQIGTFQAN